MIRTRIHVFFPLLQADKHGLKPRGRLLEVNAWNSRVRFEKAVIVLWYFINPLETGKYIEFFFLFGYTDKISLVCNNCTIEGYTFYLEKKRTKNILNHFLPLSLLKAFLKFRLTLKYFPKLKNYLIILELTI